MQTLGLSDSTPRSESRLKSLFWPTIRNEVDLDTVTTQGFWICWLVGLIGLAMSIVGGFSSLFFGLAGAFESVFYLLAGIGVRMRSRVAAVSAFAAYLLSGIVLQKYTHNGFGLPRILFLALLLANVRGIQQSASWPKPEPGDAPVRLDETLRDKLVDQLPAFLWPKARILFYVLATVELLLLLLQLLPLRPSAGGALS